jgi:hypothetical protein
MILCIKFEPTLYIVTFCYAKFCALTNIVTSAYLFPKCKSLIAASLMCVSAQTQVKKRRIVQVQSHQLMTLSVKDNRNENTP